jgi:hypothetical protein
MAIWHLLNYGEYQPPAKDLNMIASSVPLEDGRRWKPSLGLTEAQSKRICQEFGLKLLTVGFDGGSNAHLSPFELAYLYQLSGFPTLIIFPSRPGEPDVHHVVPVVGHTLNLGEWLPQAKSRYRLPNAALRARSHPFTPSVEWVPHLVVHDDLLGPYFCLSATALTRHESPNADQHGRATAIWAVVPNDYNAGSPATAQEVGALLFQSLAAHQLRLMQGEWATRLARRWKRLIDPRSFSLRELPSDLVVRTVLVNKADYTDHLSSVRDHEARALRLRAATRKRIASIPHEQMWLIEFSIPDLFCGNGTKIGEMLLPPDAGNSLVDGVGVDIELIPLLFRLLGTITAESDRGFFEVIHQSRFSHCELFTP